MAYTCCSSVLPSLKPHLFAEMEKGTSSSPSDEACPGWEALKGKKGTGKGYDSDSDDGKGKKRKGKYYDSDSDDGKGLKGNKGKGEFYYTKGKHYYLYSDDEKGKKGKRPCRRCGSELLFVSRNSCMECKGERTPRAICRHPRCLIL